jgi:hypothetical protein
MSSFQSLKLLSHFGKPHSIKDGKRKTTIRKDFQPTMEYKLIEAMNNVKMPAFQSLKLSKSTLDKRAEWENEDS